MTTVSSRVQFNLSAKDQTASAFAAARRSMQSLEGSVRQLKGLFAGALGGATFAKAVRELIRVSAETEPVKRSFAGLSAALIDFAKKIGDNGLNSALVFFSNRMGSMVSGTDGLAKSIGGFLGGGVRILASVFEGVGRAIAFAYDNSVILGSFLAAMGIVAFAQRVIGTAVAFVYFAKTIHATGLIMATFSAISRANLLVFLALAVGVAYATDSVKELKDGIDTLWQKVKDVFPAMGEFGTKLGFDMSALSESSDMLAYTSKYLDTLPAVLNGAGGATATLGKSAKEAAVNFSSLADTGQQTASVFEGVGQTFSSAFGTAFNSVVEGTLSVKAAFASMAKSILSNMASMAANKLFSGLFSSLLGGLLGGGGGGIAGPFTNTFGGPKALGGPVSAGKSYLVGERGPELFMPGRSGSIAPNGGSGGVNVYANFSGSNNDATGMALLRADLQNFKNNLPNLIKSTVSHERGRNPAFAK